jgi:3-hydroxy-9,10-secoandrosta-1,3,5(10)-triene-9,17-dione monooxygenase reductase component
MSRTSPIAPDVYRRVFGQLPTGVTVVTADHAELGPVGMACNSMTSVSLDPPLMLVCPAKASTTWPAIDATGRFCVNVMASHHADATRAFSRRDVDRFEGVSWHRRACGPALDDALAWIDCRIQARHDAGDHLVVLGEILALQAAGAGYPLVFFRSRYGTFADTSEAAGGGAGGFRESA